MKTTRKTRVQGPLPSTHHSTARTQHSTQHHHPRTHRNHNSKHRQQQLRQTTMFCSRSPPKTRRPTRKTPTQSRSAVDSLTSPPHRHDRKPRRLRHTLRHLHRSRPQRGRLHRHNRTRALSKTPLLSTSLLFVGRPQGKAQRRRSQRVAPAPPSEILAHHHINHTISPCRSPPSQRCLPPLSPLLPFLPLPFLPQLFPSSSRVRRTLSPNTPEPRSGHAPCAQPSRKSRAGGMV